MSIEMTNDYKAERAGEVRQLLNYIRDNPTVRYPAGWRESVRAEAIELGLIESIKSRSNLIQASRVMPKDMILVYWNSDRPELGQVPCCAQRRHPENGWLVSHYGSSLMSVAWNYTLQGWCFTPERD